MCIYKKKREYSDCLPALRIYTIFIKSMYIAECFMNRRWLEPFCCFAFPLPSSACVVARLLTRSVSLFHSHSWRKIFKQCLLSRSGAFVRQKKYTYFFLLFSVDWKYGQKYTRATYTLLRIPFILFYFIQFFFFLFFNGYEKV
jgi:hypothetical protein